MPIIEDLAKQNIPTEPDDTSDPARFAQPVETTKDAFILELRGFFDRNKLTTSRLAEVPTIRKFDISFKPKESSLETAVKLIQKFPDINENLPLIAVLGATGRNLPMGIGGQFVAPVAPRTFVRSTINQPYVLAPDGTLIYKTTNAQKEEKTTTIIFRDSRFNDITQATAQEVIAEINFQSLFGSGTVNENDGIDLAFGGLLTHSVTGDIEIIGGTNAAALGFTGGQNAVYTNQIAKNRYLQSTYLDIAIEVAAEDHNVRTELSDLLWSFFTFFLNDRDYTLLGRSIFDNSISNETYQVIIKPDPSMAGEQEVPRPNDEQDKIYVNRLNFPVTTIQYSDRSVIVPGTTSTPLYLDADKIEFDENIPFKN